VVELQLTGGAAAHRIAVIEGLESLFNVQPLDYLGEYDKRIDKDIAYVSRQKKRIRPDRLGRMQRVKRSFHSIIKPVSDCVQTAIEKKKWLSIDSAREMLRPAVNALEDIILAEDDLKKANTLAGMHKQFWQRLLEVPEKINTLVKTPDCEKVPKYSADQEDLLPAFSEYKDLPYLYVAAALAASFMEDSDKALQILDAAASFDFPDYFFLQLQARLRFYLSKPGNLLQSYLGPLELMRTTAQKRIKVLQAAKQECRTDTDLLCREQYAEMGAINIAAYFLAEDVARDSPYAQRYAPLLQDYVHELSRIVDQWDNPASTTASVYSLHRDERDKFADTYGYATLVLEARKPTPDYDMVKRKVIPLLDSAVTHLRLEMEGKRNVTRSEARIVRVPEGHLISAHDFVGE
jgi:hypothetical protein